MKRQFVLLGALLVLASCNELTERKQGFAVHGIDVSHYQKKIDWPRVAAQDVEFAFIKASEGQTMQDTNFCKNWESAQAAGILRGAYHFFRPNVPAEAQALNFLSAVEMQHGDLPPVLDVEVMDGASPEVLVRGVATWLQIVGDHWKVKPIIYTNQKFYNRYLAGRLPEHMIWLARYTDWRKPEMIDGHQWHFWQYGNRGRLAGIVGDVDLNVFNGDRNALLALTFQRPAPLLNRMPDPVLPPHSAEPHALAAEPSEPIAVNP